MMGYHMRFSCANMGMSSNKARAENHGFDSENMFQKNVNGAISSHF